MKHLILFLSVGVLWSAEQLKGQQLPLLAQYRENHLLLNPASISANYTNNNSGLTAGLLGRYQWLGLPDAPKTQTAYCSYFWEDKNLAFGGYLINDQTGSIGFTGIYGQLGYTLDLNRYGHKLSLGLNGGLVQYRADIRNINFETSIDPNLLQPVFTQLFPDVGIGVYYYFDKFFYAGVSVPQVFGLNLNYKIPGGEFKIKRMQHGYLLVGGYFGIGEASFLEPSLWLQYTANAPVSVNLNLRTLIAIGNNFEWWVGGGYSTGGLAHFESGFTLTDMQLFRNHDGLRFGVSYDYTLTDYSRYAKGAYELHLGYYIDI